MHDKFTLSIKFFQGFLCEFFVVDKKESIEVIMMLVAGNLMGFYNPNQLADYLGINKKQLYKHIKDLSVYQWKRMLMIIGCQQALPLIRDALSKSASTQSRRCITLSVDDTVIKRIGQILSYTYSWYSGQYNHVVNGQNIIAITIKIGKITIPLNIRPVSKQGRANTEKPELLKTMLREVISFFSDQGIDLTQFPITFDSWYGSQPLREILEEFGFNDILVDTKSDYVYEIDNQKDKMRNHKKQTELKEAWGCDVEVSRKVGVSPTFGKVVLLFFADGARKRCMMSFSLLRACEILRIWRQHHGIERFWRCLKHLLGLSKMSLHGRCGAYAGIGVKLLSYLMGLSLSNELKTTFHQLKVLIRREIAPSEFFSEHFHLEDWVNVS